MKFLTIALFAAAVSVHAINEEADGKGKECCDRKPERNCDRKPEPRECPRVGDIDPKICGLGRCECPDKCSALWFPQPCNNLTSTTPTIFSQGFGSVYCKDFFYDCEIDCKKDIDGLTPAELLTLADYEIRGACIAFESIDRPECFLPEAGCISSDNCALNTTLVQLNGANFTCIGTHPELLRRGCRKSCPKTHYPTCLLVKKFFD